MKHPHLLSILLMVLSVVSAAFPALAYTDHTPRYGDLLHPGIANSRALILSVVDSTKTVVLNQDAVSFDEARDAAVYIDGDTISYVQFATKHRFVLRDDTLSYIGYENRASDFRLDAPAPVAVFPLMDGAAVKDEWRGHLFQYGAMALKRVRGISQATVQKCWTLTDGSGTPRTATRLHWSLDMAYADADSINTEMPDSVASGMISEMQIDVGAILSERLLTERSLWFSDDARYPVLTDSRVSRVMLDEAGAPSDTIPLYMLAMRYPPAWQHSDTGEDLHRTMPSVNVADSSNGPDAGRDIGRRLTVGEPSVSGSTVTVTLSSQNGPMSATVTLFTDSGIRLTEPMTVTVGSFPRSHSIEAPGGWSGIMLLRIDAGEEHHSMTIIR